MAAPPDAEPEHDRTRRAPPRVEATRRVAVACLCALIVLGLAWELWLAPLRPGGSWWALKVLPLAAALAGLLKRRLYTYRWMSLLVWLYFIEGVVRATSERGVTTIVLAAAQVLLSLVLFAACTAHVWWRLKGSASGGGSA